MLHKPWRGRLFVIGLIAVLVGVCWGLIYLGVVFVRERNLALENVDRQRLALSEYAQTAIQQNLAEQFTRKSIAINNAAENILQDDQGLFLQLDGTQILPRDNRYNDSDSRFWINDYQWLASGEEKPLSTSKSPWHELLEAHKQIVGALDADDQNKAANLIRRALSILVNHTLDDRRELVFTLAILSRLSAHSKPDPQLVRSLLREGLQNQQGSHIEPAQKILLQNRFRLSKQEFVFLAQKIESIWSQNNLDTDESFSRRWRQTGYLELNLPTPPENASLLSSEGWFLQQTQHNEIKGFRVDTKKLVSNVESGMRNRGLLTADDTLQYTRHKNNSGVDLAFAVHIESAALKEHSRWINNLYRLKRVLLVVTFLLVLLSAYALWKSMQRKQRFLDMRTELISTITHELKTPLASVRLMAETLQNRLANEPKARDYPARILSDVDGLTRLVDDVLAYNRIGHKSFKLRKESVFISSLLEEVQTEIEVEFEKPCRWKYSELNGVTVSADPVWLKIVFKNLARNAFLYNDNKQVEIEVCLHSSANKLTFSDNGVGIPQDHKDNVFEAFMRSDSKDSRGSGLGLAICKRIMEAHSGDISVLRTDTAGSTFQIQIPA